MEAVQIKGTTCSLTYIIGRLVVVRPWFTIPNTHTRTIIIVTLTVRDISNTHQLRRTNTESWSCRALWTFLVGEGVGSPSLLHSLPTVLSDWRNQWSVAGVLLLILANLSTGKVLKRSVSKTPYLIHDTTEAPHITGSGVLIVVNGL